MVLFIVKVVHQNDNAVNIEMTGIGGRFSFQKTRNVLLWATVVWHVRQLATLSGLSDDLSSMTKWGKPLLVKFV